MVGYQGESSRFVIHRQSQTEGRTIQTGTPRAPARWAGELSAEITRSRFFITAAVSAKSSMWRPRSVTEKPSGSVSSWSRPKFFWRLNRRTPGSPRHGFEPGQPERAFPVLVVVGVALPDDPDLELTNAFRARPASVPRRRARRRGREPRPGSSPGSCPGSAPGS